MIEDIRKETDEEKILHLQKLSGWSKNECDKFIYLVCRYLDSCGYFMGDFNIHNLPQSDNYINYSDRDFGRWLLDMALQYNMEQGKEYFCKLIGDRQRNEFDKRYYDENFLIKEDIYGNS